MNEANKREIMNEIWNMCDALESSFRSILNAEELDSTSAQIAMQESLKEFNSVMENSISKWSNGKTSSIVVKNDEVTEADIDYMKSKVARLQNEIEKGCSNLSNDTVVDGLKKKSRKEKKK